MQKKLCMRSLLIFFSLFLFSSKLSAKFLDFSSSKKQEILAISLIKDKNILWIGSKSHPLKKDLEKNNRLLCIRSLNKITWKKLKDSSRIDLIIGSYALQKKLSHIIKEEPPYISIQRIFFSNAPEENLILKRWEVSKKGRLLLKTLSKGITKEKIFHDVKNKGTTVVFFKFPSSRSLPLLEDLTLLTSPQKIPLEQKHLSSSISFSNFSLAKKLYIFLPRKDFLKDEEKKIMIKLERKLRGLYKAQKNSLWTLVYYRDMEIEPWDSFLEYGNQKIHVITKHLKEFL